MAAHTASIAAADVLRQFNLVVFGDAVSYSHVDGRAYVGGNLAGGDFVQHAGDTPASDYAGLTVAGNASQVNVNDALTLLSLAVGLLLVLAARGGGGRMARPTGGLALQG